METYLSDLNERLQGQFLDSSSKNGWQIIGTNLKSTNIKLVGSGSDLLNVPTVLVIGNEHVGLTQGVSKRCDFHLRIPGRNDENLDSLNVSVAAGILLSHLVLD